MVIVCAWCKCTIKQDCNPPYIVSHGICKECMREQLQQLPEDEYVDTLWGRFDIGEANNA